MDKVSRVSLLVVGLVVLLPLSTHALEVGVARLQGGEVHVIGKGAAKDAAISWQGTRVTTSTGGGSFSFMSSNIPATCVGTLSDGATTLYIAISGCTASGVTVPSSLALVPATGQTTSYAIGDDGFYQAGVHAPTPRFTDNLDGTITDNLTGLVWLKDTGCLGTTAWLGALARVDALSDGACGLSDSSVKGSWRLPNKNELQSLGHNGAGLPLDHPFTLPADDDADYYWSSTTYPFASGYAWTVRILEDGYLQRDFKGDMGEVIAVRGGF